MIINEDIANIHKHFKKAITYLSRKSLNNLTKMGKRQHQKDKM